MNFATIMLDYRLTFEQPFVPRDRFCIIVQIHYTLSRKAYNVWSVGVLPWCVCVAVASVLALAASVNSVHLSQAVSTSTPQTNDTTQAHSAVHKTNTMYVACVFLQVLSISGDTASRI